MKTKNGFTLIEVMIVVAVIAILTSVAVPGYIDYVKRGKVIEATSGLSDGRVKMEQFFQDNRTYVGGPIPAATANFTFVTNDPAAPTQTTYTIKANGIGNVSLYHYTIDQNNVKGSSTPWGNNASCWVIKKGGGC